MHGAGRARCLQVSTAASALLSGYTTTAASTTAAANTATLAAIRRHLDACLPAHLVDRIWHDGFAAERQPCFRINRLRLPRDNGGNSSSNSIKGSSASDSHDSDTGAQPGGSGPSGTPGSSGSSGGAATATAEAHVVQALLQGFGLPPSATAVEAVPYFPPARLLPAHTAQRVKVADAAHSLGPLQSGAAYFMNLSTMLAPLVLMAPPLPPPPLPQAPRSSIKYGRPGGDGAASSSSRSGSKGSSVDGGGGGGGGGALRVLDLCAAPGGKTALLADLMGNRGSLVAVDASWPRMQRALFNLERLVPPHPREEHAVHDNIQGMHQQPEQLEQQHPHQCTRGGALWRRGCVTAVHADGTQLAVDEQGVPIVRAAAAAAAASRRRDRSTREPYDEQLPVEATGVYDRVLVDAPCSSLGRMSLRRPDSYSHWRPGEGSEDGFSGERQRQSSRQRRLLEAAVRLLRPGGYLVYSTCTMDPAENEQVVAWLLQRVGGVQGVEPPLLLPTPFLAQPTEVTHALAAAANNTASSGAHTWNLRAACHAPLPARGTWNLRAALEAHRPGCTYPPILDGPAWATPRAAALLQPCSSRRRTRGGGSGGGGFEAVPGFMLSLGARELREQLARCVRVAPGPTYEGFFVALLRKL